MMNAKHLLSLFLSIGLSACSTGIVCALPTLTERPVVAMCIPNKDGIAQCYDSRQSPPVYKITSVNDYVCIPPLDNQSQEEWIKSLKSALGQ